MYVQLLQLGDLGVGWYAIEVIRGGLSSVPRACPPRSIAAQQGDAVLGQPGRTGVVQPGQLSGRVPRTVEPPAVTAGRTSSTSPTPTRRPSADSAASRSSDMTVAIPAARRLARKIRVGNKDSPLALTQEARLIGEPPALVPLVS
jgi:hypothetical protein